MLSYPCEPDIVTDWSYPPKPEWRDDLQTLYDGGNLTCTCDRSFLACDVGAEGPPPPTRMEATADFLQNMTDHDVSDYLVKTMEDFILNRWVLMIVV